MSMSDRFEPQPSGNIIHSKKKERNCQQSVSLFQRNQIAIKARKFLHNWINTA